MTDRFLRQNHELKKALSLPRIYPYQDTLWVENHSGLAGINANFIRPDYPIKYIDEPARFGRVHAVAKQNKKWVGAADPDWEGTTAYFPANED